MSTLNGLFQMKEYDRVLAMVQGSLRPNSLLTACVRRLPIARWRAAFWKVQRARELGLKWSSSPVASCNCRQDWTAPSLQPLWQLLDNALDQPA